MGRPTHPSIPSLTTHPDLPLTIPCSAAARRHTLPRRHAATPSLVAARRHPLPRRTAPPPPAPPPRAAIPCSAVRAITLALRRILPVGAATSRIQPRPRAPSSSSPSHETAASLPRTGHLQVQAVWASPLRVVLVALCDAPRHHSASSRCVVWHRCVQPSNPASRGRSLSQCFLPSRREYTSFPAIVRWEKVIHPKYNSVTLTCKFCN